MSKFIQLTLDNSKKPVTVNVDRILYFIIAKPGSNFTGEQLPDYTYIKFEGEVGINVIETPLEIEELIKK